MVKKTVTVMSKTSDHKVELISHTPFALELLLYTKNTRLQGGQTLQDIVNWPEEKKLEHLAYMRGTIKSSWEFVDYVFKISGVTRAFTHQLVRTRTGSYAQESMRTVTPADGVLIPDSLDAFDQECGGYSNAYEAFGRMVGEAMDNYAELVSAGVAPQDARGLLPTNVKTSIIAKFNLRTIHETANLRLCTRTQGEYQDVFRDMRQEIINVHPWAEDFIQVYCVNHMSCMFPHYADCPIKQKIPMFSHPKQDDDVRGIIKGVWENERYEAKPKLTGDGRTK